jgi:hypothetical protein
MGAGWRFCSGRIRIVPVIFAELDAAQKDALSHRGNALRTLAQAIARDSSILA